MARAKNTAILIPFQMKTVGRFGCQTGSSPDLEIASSMHSAFGGAAGWGLVLATLTETPKISCLFHGVSDYGRRAQSRSYSR